MGLRGKSSAGNSWYVVGMPVGSAALLTLPLLPGWFRLDRLLMVDWRRSQRGGGVARQTALPALGSFGRWFFMQLPWSRLHGQVATSQSVAGF